MQRIILSLIACSLFTVNSVQAESFQCSFTEPFITILVSTTNKRATLSSYGETDKQFKIINSTKVNGVEKYQLNNGKLITIFRNILGNDGMSDINYPYEITYGRLYGACENKVEYNRTVIERIRSFREKAGLVLVNYWPGEYGFTSGYQVIKKVTISATSMWTSVKRGKVAKKDCTLPKGKYLIDSKKKRFELYAHLGVAHQYTIENTKKERTFISYVGEGYCLAEEDGKILDIVCPDLNFPTHEDEGAGYGEVTPYGNYAYVKCSEGHLNWIHKSSFENDEFFKKVFQGY